MDLRANQILQKKKITEFKDIVIETIQNKHTKQKDQRKNE